MLRLQSVTPPSTPLRFLGLFGLLCGIFAICGTLASLPMQFLRLDEDSSAPLLFGGIFVAAILGAVGPAILVSWIFGARGADRLSGRWLEFEGSRITAVACARRHSGVIVKRYISDGPFVSLEGQAAELRATRPDGSRLILNRFYRSDAGKVYELRLCEGRLVPREVERLEVVSRLLPGPWRQMDPG